MTSLGRFLPLTISTNERLLVAVACSRAAVPLSAWLPKIEVTRLVLLLVDDGRKKEMAMGHSAFDPAAKDRRPWNVGRMVDAKRALKPQ
jgi:hypothetical protein